MSMIVWHQFFFHFLSQILHVLKKIVLCNTLESLIYFVVSDGIGGQSFSTFLLVY